VTDNRDSLSRVIQEDAKKCSIEGTVKFEKEDVMHIVACGSKDNVQDFLDRIHQYKVEKGVAEVEVEPFLKEKDYRGVFRVIE
jgi:acylphosphatase